MNFHRDRNLIILSVLFFAIIGSFLLGCAEGSNSTPVGALMTDINNEKYQTGRRSIIGTFETNKDYFKDELGDIPVILSKYVDSQKDYVEIARTTTSHNTNEKTGQFKFTGLNIGSYKISTPKTKTFKAFDGFASIQRNETDDLLDQYANASASTYITYDPDKVSFRLSVIDNEINGLIIRVVSAHTGSPLDSATIKIDNKAVDVTNKDGITEVNEIPVGFHDIKVSRSNFDDITGKFEVKEGTETTLPSINGTNPLNIALVEKGDKSSITGTYFDPDNKHSDPRYVALYKYNFVSNIDNIDYYNEEFIKLTKTSYGIDGTPDGSFKFLNLDDGFYQIYVSVNGSKHPEPKAIKGSDTYEIYNLSNYDKSDIANYRWQPLATTDYERTSRPINLKAGTTVYWTNIDNLSTK